VLDELKTLDPTSTTMMLSLDLYDYEDPRASCDDTVAFLSEYWASVVNRMAILYAGKAISTRILFLFQKRARFPHSNQIRR